MLKALTLSLGLFAATPAFASSYFTCKADFEGSVIDVVVDKDAAGAFSAMLTVNGGAPRKSTDVAAEEGPYTYDTPESKQVIETLLEMSGFNIDFSKVATAKGVSVDGNTSSGGLTYFELFDAKGATVAKFAMHPMGIAAACK